MSNRNVETESVSCAVYDQVRWERDMAMKQLEELGVGFGEVIPEKEPCEVCTGLERGDTLYCSSDWDGGIGFDYIRDIVYCPVCGRKLNEWKG